MTPVLRDGIEDNVPHLLREMGQLRHRVAAQIGRGLYLVEQGHRSKPPNPSSPGGVYLISIKISFFSLRRDIHAYATDRTGCDGDELCISALGFASSAAEPGWRFRKESKRCCRGLTTGRPLRRSICLRVWATIRPA